MEKAGGNRMSNINEFIVAPIIVSAVASIFSRLWLPCVARKTKECS